jgi:hypothetical protein
MEVKLVDISSTNYGTNYDGVKIKLDVIKSIILTHEQSIELQVLLMMKNKNLNDALMEKAE